MHRDLVASEKYLLNSCMDFSATYMAVSMLEHDLSKNVSLGSSKTVNALYNVIIKKVHSSQRQSYFLYRKAANTLSFLASAGEDPGLAAESIKCLKHIVADSVGPSHRAAAEALGSLPLKIKGPSLREKSISKVTSIRWDDLCRKTGLNEGCDMKCIGRSLVFSIASNLFFVIKLSRSDSESTALNREALWMEYLQAIKHEFPIKFDIPTPLRFGEAHLFRLTDFPDKLKKKMTIHMDSAIGFMVHSDYFVYPNPLPDEKSVDWNNFMEVMRRNAWLLGRLTSMGIVHTAPVPLFHNRVQRHRRRDEGYYEWPRGGRLDRWLMSCRYPNLGKSGVRDFEHFEAISGSSYRYYRLIGNHFMSIILICASYFRNHHPERTGFDKKGYPIDVRNLFCPDLMQELIEASFNSYYEGFTGRKIGDRLPVDFDNFVLRSIDEFGVDQYMEEIFRATDQQEMSDDEFNEFLLERGFTGDNINGLSKGLEDITIMTGPHLGGFNQRISLPELIHFTGTAASYCIGDRYIVDQNLE
ncbi:MAG: SidJ-related pseudokinase [Desulfobacteraceae bacterium]|nr:SidJ-related pseudokinase [Desulfobacteraceae bacterium]MDH3838117.1 SidJ-related pseudokinase [Desulfobacteraceae bacterium]MDH3876066.1 SidJ-related pseudokinase [Desulfobacteraceae bacterium]